MMAYTANYVDRQILAILMQPIKLELGLSDTQLGFLSGLTFAIFYATLGVPIAMWADRSNRRNIVALALTIFSGMTVVCGFVTSFAQLALARIGVGVGEAGSSPPSHSMIADMFPPEKRASAMGVYSLGINLGILIGFLVGGWVSQWYGWRVAFFLVGAPGFQMSGGEIGTWLALIIGISGGAGTFLTGYLADRFGKRDVRWNLWVVAIIIAICFPFQIAMYTSYDKYTALLLFIYPAFAGAAYIAPALAMTQSLVTIRMRAQASAILFLILNLIGMGLGPQLAGVLSDLYNPTYGDESLRYALLTISVVWLWAAVHLMLGARTLKEDIERARLHGLR